MNVCLFLVNIHRKMSAVSSLLLDILSTKIYFRQIPKNVWLHGYIGVYWCWSFSISPVWSGGSGLLNNGTNLTEFSELNWMQFVSSPLPVVDWELWLYWVMLQIWERSYKRGEMSARTAGDQVITISPTSWPEKCQNWPEMPTNPQIYLQSL